MHPRRGLLEVTLLVLLGLSALLIALAGRDGWRWMLAAQSVVLGLVLPLTRDLRW